MVLLKSFLSDALQFKKSQQFTLCYSSVNAIYGLKKTLHTKKCSLLTGAIETAGGDSDAKLENTPEANPWRLSENISRFWKVKKV